jgi:glycosyltransferase involved in cell wall biosynthesis
MTIYIFWLSIALIIYPWVIYPSILIILDIFNCLLNKGLDKTLSVESGINIELPAYTHIVCAHNEEDLISSKVYNSIKSLTSNSNNELIIVSDYSSDETVARAKSIANEQVRVVENLLSRGRAGATNYAVSLAKNSIIIFSDAETVIPDKTFEIMLKYFSDKRLGCVNAEIVFDSQNNTGVTQGGNIYWLFELWLREKETSLGLNCFSSGPCMAIRKMLYIPIFETGDIDFITPIDVVLQGFRVMQLRSVYAFDNLSNSNIAEFKTRVRMVSKNFNGTVRRWGIKNIFIHPIYSWVIYSHKILRWCVPYFVMIAFITNMFLLGDGGIYSLMLLCQIIIFASMLAGFYMDKIGLQVRFFNLLFAFGLANVAFAVGVSKSIRGSIPSFYKPTRSI